LYRDGERISSLDLYGRGFVLLGGPDAQTWCECAREVSRDLKGVTLETVQPGAALTDPSGNLARLHGIQADGCVLVRPDGFVGWRARDGKGASTQQLRTALAQV